MSALLRFFVTDALTAGHVRAGRSNSCILIIIVRQSLAFFIRRNMYLWYNHSILNRGTAMRNPFKVISEEHEQRRLEKEQHALEDSRRLQEEEDRLNKAIEAEENNIKEQRKAKEENEDKSFIDKINPLKIINEKKEEKIEHDERINNVVEDMKKQFALERQEIHLKRERLKAERQGDYKKSVAILVVTSLVLLIAIITTLTIVGVNIHQENERERQEALIAERENQEAQDRIKQEQERLRREEEQKKQAEIQAAQQAEAAKKAEEARQAEAARQAEIQAAQQAEAARQAEEARAGTTGPSGNSGASEDVSASYIINTNTGVFHTPGCRSISRMSSKNKQSYSGSRQDLINQGYTPCGKCHP